jgi:tripartite-type tricarboxylate transporter receptor subunit TctC
MKTLSRLFAVLLALGAAPSIAQDNWPAKPIRIIVPSAPGGGTDIYARLMAFALAEPLKQQIIVDNRPGGNAMIGAEAVARSAPDGYTLLISASPALVLNPVLYKKLPYDADRDFAPVSAGVITPLIFVVHPSVPARTLGDLVSMAKKEPGKYAYGSAQLTSATTLGVQILEHMTGAKFNHIPYKGLGQAFQNLLSGQIAFMLSDFPTALAHIKSGRVIPLAASHRTKVLPQLPTNEEAGFPIGEVVASFMVTAPAGTPAPIVHRLNSEINRAMKTPSIVEKLDAQVFIPVFGSPEDFGARLKQQRAMWAENIARIGLKVE